MIVLIDNYDSFAYNLARYLERLSGDVVCLRNDAATAAVVEQLEPKLIVLSPGPGTPRDAGNSLDIVGALGDRVPMLGICLGCQVIVEAYGGRIVPIRNPIHGMASLIRHDGTQEFDRLPDPFTAARYHSLVAHPDQLPSCLMVSATTQVFDPPDRLPRVGEDDSVRDGGSRTGAVSTRSHEAEATNAERHCDLIMAVRHRSLPIFGWQFHPESILTPHGYDLLCNLLNVLDLPISGRVPTIEDERIRDGTSDAPHPKQPITF